MEALTFNKNPKIIKILINAGADINVKNDEGYSAKDIAFKYANVETLKTFIDNAANYRDLNQATKDLFLAISNESTTRGQIGYLLLIGADINARDQDGVTPLMIAAKYNTNPEILRYLLEAKAYVIVQDNEGKTAKDYARQNTNPEILEFFEVLEND